MNNKLWILLITLNIAVVNKICSVTPLGMLTPYDINIRFKKPAPHHFYFNVMGEKSYNVKGYATDDCLEKSFLTNPLQIYENQQNIISMYQGIDNQGNVEIISAPFTQLLDSIAGGAGGGVSNLENGLFTPTGKFCAGQVAFSGMYALGHDLFISAHLPVYFVKLHCVDWQYSGNNELFSGARIQEELVSTFTQDAKNIFNLNVEGWKKHGPGDLTLLLEWQKDFPQRRQMLKNVQSNIRLGLSLPTGCKADETVLMSTPFGADGSVGVPFGGGLGMNLANCAEIGFSGQFWYFWSNEKERRIKSFPTQTTLLLPLITHATREYSFTQNFNLYAKVFSLCKKFTLKFGYQYWRRGEDVITPTNTNFYHEVVNSDLRLQETTKHFVLLALTYSPLSNDFKKVVPQLQLFWKGAVKGSRSAIASTAGAQFSLIF